MHAPLFEAVPNFSEGKDNAKISRITGAIRAVPGIRILGLHSDPDHNRSVLTFAGEEDPMLSGALALAKACATELDLALQSGEHPRMGVLDVLPFVPLEGATMDDAVRLAHRAGETLGSLGFPVYLYGSAATNPHRQALPDVRRGGYEGVASRIRDPLWKPDYGPTTLDPHRGAVAVGARPFLVAFNAYLDTDEVEVARAVARRVRESGGGLPAVRALGFHVGGMAQVSMNLTDLEQTPIPVALEAVRSAAADLGVSVESTELVGLAPLEAVLQTARYYLGLRELEADHILESRLYGPSDPRSL
ncbi:MAG: glutamate formimidoyltransferase [Actinomycetota bacterium]|nr:glutamate formimidoyltransferase [Actinomycetota bacterium]MDQ3437443.1 glutamate formimidoyltransferase [Actinomycetota bacterium]